MSPTQVWSGSSPALPGWNSALQRAEKAQPDNGNRTSSCPSQSACPAHIAHVESLPRARAFPGLMPSTTHNWNGHLSQRIGGGPRSLLGRAHFQLFLGPTSLSTTIPAPQPGRRRKVPLKPLQRSGCRWSGVGRWNHSPRRRARGAVHRSRNAVPRHAATNPRRRQQHRLPMLCSQMPLS